jgi:hypothetical protein
MSFKGQVARNTFLNSVTDKEEYSSVPLQDESIRRTIETDFIVSVQVCFFDHQSQLLVRQFLSCEDTSISNCF